MSFTFFVSEVRDKKGIVTLFSSTYMSFIGVILSIKGRILFNWVCGVCVRVCVYLLNCT